MTSDGCSICHNVCIFSRCVSMEKQHVLGNQERKKNCRKSNEDKMSTIQKIQSNRDAFQREKNGQSVTSQLTERNEFPNHRNSRTTPCQQCNVCSTADFHQAPNWNFVTISIPKFRHILYVASSVAICVLHTRCSIRWYIVQRLLSAFPRVQARCRENNRCKQ